MALAQLVAEVELDAGDRDAPPLGTAAGAGNTDLP